MPSIRMVFVDTAQCGMGLSGSMADEMSYVRKAKKFGFRAKKGHNTVIISAKDPDEFGEVIYLVACSMCRGLHLMNHLEFLQEKACTREG